MNALSRRELLALAAASVAGLAAVGPGVCAADAKSAAGASFLADLTRIFSQPPRDAKPAMFWYWLQGNVTREGITADLEAMREAGIGTVMLFSIGAAGPGSLVDAPAQSLTALWWELIEFAFAEAGRLDVELVMNACDGWATASGPWIAPELSMQRLTWSEQVVDGDGKPFRGKVVRPDAVLDHYRDLRLLALPRPASWDRTSARLKPRVSGNLTIADYLKLLDPDNADVVVHSETAGDLQFDFGEPFLLRSVTVRTPPETPIFPGVQRAANSLHVDASDDGVEFRPIGQLEYPRHGWQSDLNVLTHAIPETRARYFRLRYAPGSPGPLREDLFFGQSTALRLCSVLLSGRPQVHQVVLKSGDTWGIARRTSDRDLPDAACVPAASIIDLTDRMKPDGSIDWTAPNGRWTLLRIGHTSTGKSNSMAGNGQGLECDKLSKAAARAQFDGWFGAALRRAGPRLAGKVLHVFHVDSWEANSQNWSPLLADEFKVRRSYDVLPWLPVLAGVPIDSADFSERVLFDHRRTIAELVAANFYGEMQRLAHANGCLFSGEVSNPTFPSDGLDYGRYVDIPMGEFWLRTPSNYKPTDIKEAVSAARIYGRRIAGAEAFTQLNIRWDETPWMLKALGDHHFAEGINRLYLHVYAMQPWQDRAPGMTLGGVGTFFGRTQTWWRPGKAWLDYLARSQALLQEGVAVADIAMFIGEDIPARAVIPEDLPVQLPQGYAYDSINRQALMELALVEDRALVLPSGARYRALILPRGKAMTPELAERLAQFAAAGLIIVGDVPDTSPGAYQVDIANSRVRQLASRMRLVAYVDAEPLQKLLESRQCSPDVVFTNASAPSPEWTHRRGKDWDLYFFCNPADAEVRVAATVRATGIAELWNADSGLRAPLPARKVQGERTEVAFALAPRGAVFLMLGRGSATHSAETIEAIEGPAGSITLAYEGERPIALTDTAGEWSVRFKSGKTRQIAVAAPAPIIPIEGRWSVQFGNVAERQWAQLISWSADRDEAIRHFSGTALYSIQFTCPRAALNDRFEWRLRLGRVAELALVRVNGESFPALWKPPFDLVIGRALRAGVNTLEIEVANTWLNRLIGDAAVSDGQQRTSFVVPERHLMNTDWLPKANDTLLEAGLLGPVRLEARARVLL